MTLILALFWLGGFVASDKHVWGFWASLFWPYYAGKVAFQKPHEALQ